MKNIIIAIALLLSVTTAYSQGKPYNGPSQTPISRNGVPEGKPIISFYMKGVMPQHKLYTEIFSTADSTLMLVIRRGDLPESANVCYYATLHKQSTGGTKFKFVTTANGLAFIFYEIEGTKEKEIRYEILFSQMGLS